MLTGANYDVSSSELLERLNWKNFDTRFEFNKAVLVYSIFENGNAPCLLYNSFLHETITLTITIFGIMVQTSQFQNPKKNFSKEVLNTEVLSFGTICLIRLSPPSMYAFKRIIHAGL